MNGERVTNQSYYSFFSLFHFLYLYYFICLIKTNQITSATKTYSPHKTHTYCVIAYRTKGAFIYNLLYMVCKKNTYLSSFKIKSEKKIHPNNFIYYRTHRYVLSLSNLTYRHVCTVDSQCYY